MFCQSIMSKRIPSSFVVKSYGILAYFIYYHTQGMRLNCYLLFHLALKKWVFGEKTVDKTQRSVIYYIL